MPIKTYSYVYDSLGNQKLNGNIVGTMDLYLWEQSMFHKIKTRAIHECMGCGKDIKGGCYAYGAVYWSRRVCINCFERFINNFVNSIERHKKMAKLTLKAFKKEEGYLIKHNLASSV